LRRARLDSDKYCPKEREEPVEEMCPHYISYRQPERSGITESPQRANEFEGVVVASVGKMLGTSRCPDFEWTGCRREADSAQRMLKDLRKQKEMIGESTKAASRTVQFPPIGTDP
jgi:hypothetical protein